MYSLSNNQISGIPKLKLLSKWHFMLESYIKDLVSIVKYYELRPFTYK